MSTRLSGLAGWAHNPGAARSKAACEVRERPRSHRAPLMWYSIGTVKAGAGYLTNDYKLIDDQPGYRRAMKAISGAKRIGLDLESNGFFRYPERVCLLQVSAPSGAFVIDPLAVEDLSALGATLANSEGRNDTPLRQLRRREPRPRLGLPRRRAFRHADSGGVRRDTAAWLGARLGIRLGRIHTQREEAAALRLVAAPAQREGARIRRRRRSASVRPAGRARGEAARARTNRVGGGGMSPPRRQQIRKARPGDGGVQRQGNGAIWTVAAWRYSRRWWISARIRR